MLPLLPDSHKILQISEAATPLWILLETFIGIRVAKYA